MKCPFCAEEIQDEAIKCRYCGEWLSARGEGARSRPERRSGGATVLAGAGCVLLFVFMFAPIFSSLGRRAQNVAADARAGSLLIDEPMDRTLANMEAIAESDESQWVKDRIYWVRKKYGGIAATESGLNSFKSEMDVLRSDIESSGRLNDDDRHIQAILKKLLMCVPTGNESKDRVIRYRITDSFEEWKDRKFEADYVGHSLRGMEELVKQLSDVDRRKNFSVAVVRSYSDDIVDILKIRKSVLSSIDNHNHERGIWNV